MIYFLIAISTYYKQKAYYFINFVFNEQWIKLKINIRHLMLTMASKALYNSLQLLNLDKFFRTLTWIWLVSYRRFIGRITAKHFLNISRLRKMNFICHIESLPLMNIFTWTIRLTNHSISYQISKSINGRI